MVVLTWLSQVLLSYLRNRRLPIVLGPFARSCTQKGLAKAGVSNVLAIKQFTTKPRKWWASACTRTPICVGSGRAHMHTWPLLTHNYSLSTLPLAHKDRKVGELCAKIPSEYHCNNGPKWPIFKSGNGTKIIICSSWC